MIIKLISAKLDWAEICNKNISLPWVNDRIEYDQDDPNLTDDENNNDYFSHNSLQHDITCA